ncbi:hypothetical protein QYE76_029126 [Lolium multiflorum]|uniref:Uncharacterized protein n=1 Tax=Lolium multiflorum TaxID=4521 RepID=A0AAD8QM87_LOLMU|nr:hypothetical protein QYE76_029126 [Lolium multiflorum]
MAPKRRFSPGANDGEASSSRRPPPVLRARGNRGGLHIEEAARGGVALAQPVPLQLPKSESPEEDPDLRAALALSTAKEEAKWPHLAAAIRTSATEEEARQKVEDAEAWALLEQEREQRLREEAQLRVAAAEQWAAPDLHSAWEEALWSPWPESPARSSHNSASPPGDVGDGDEAHRD